MINILKIEKNITKNFIKNKLKIKQQILMSDLWT